MALRQEIVGRDLFDILPAHTSDSQARSLNVLRASLERMLQGRFGDAVGVQEYDFSHTVAAWNIFGEVQGTSVFTPIFGPGGGVAYIILRAERARQDGLAYAEAIVETVREPLLILGGDLRVRSTNRSFCRSFRVTSEDVRDRLLFDLGDGQWDIPRLRTLLEEVLPEQTSFDDFEVEHDFPPSGPRSWS